MADRQTPDRYITLSARHSQSNHVFLHNFSAVILNANEIMQLLYQSACLHLYCRHVVNVPCSSVLIRDEFLSLYERFWVTVGVSTVRTSVSIRISSVPVFGVDPQIAV